METLVLLAIAVLLYLDLQEHRAIRERAEAALMAVRQAERRINKLTDEAIFKMIDELYGPK